MGVLPGASGTLRPVRSLDEVISAGAAASYEAQLSTGDDGAISGAEPPAGADPPLAPSALPQPVGPTPSGVSLPGPSRNEGSKEPTPGTPVPGQRPGPAEPGGGSSGLTPGAIAGVVLGSLAAAVLLAVCAVLLVRRKRAAAPPELPVSQNAAAAGGAREEDGADRLSIKQGVCVWGGGGFVCA